MTIAGIDVIDADSLDAAADSLEDAEAWTTNLDCNGAKRVNNYPPDAGWISIEIPHCQGAGPALEIEPDGGRLVA